MKADDPLFTALHATASAPNALSVRGRVIQVLGTILKAVVPGVCVGELCHLYTPGQERHLTAEVVGFDRDCVLLTVLGDMEGISPETEVIPLHERLCVPSGEALLGRVIDGLGNPLDGATQGDLNVTARVPLSAMPPNPLHRRVISAPLTLGIRALDTALTCGEGQRMGIFAAAGVGKSTLLAQIMRNTSADVIVLALIGERGREVRAFLEEDLGAEGLQRAVVVVSTSDRPAMERIKAAYAATALAEAFRAEGKRVLLLMDSITRFARARREVGLAMGEPPVRRGFPPSVFAELPRLMERAGNDAHGSITALYTVLVEGELAEDPIAEEVKSILDGHIVLSNTLAERSHFPAIDILRSVSRCQRALLRPDQFAHVQRLRTLLSEHEAVELLVKLGEYQRGSNAAADDALAHIENINAFLKQAQDERDAPETMWQRLEKVLA